MPKELEQFLRDTDHGLSQKNKRLYSKYFYDEHGSHLFNKITEHPNYYLTAAEIEILSNNKKYFSELLKGEQFNLVELGPGEGIKTNMLIKQFLDDALQFRYVPVDISIIYLQLLSSRLRNKFPSLDVTPVHAEFTHCLKFENDSSQQRNMLLFLGSSIGNFNPESTHNFLSLARQSLKPGDYFLIGFDLIKDLEVLHAAYDDDSGITRKFNFNLLHRINRELGGNFDVNKFIHRAAFNSAGSAMESFLVSTHKQVVDIELLNKSFAFNENEAIHTEYSYKYTLDTIADYATQNGFSIIKNFLDSKEYFVDSLWQVN